MADTKISGLTDGVAAVATDRIPIARSPFGATDNCYLTPLELTGIGALIANGTANSILYVGAGPVLAQDATNFTWGGTAGKGLFLGAGTATTDVAALSITRTNNNAAVATGVKIAFTDTTSAAGFLPFQVLGGAAGTTNLFSVDKNGNIVPGAAGSATKASISLSGQNLNIVAGAAGSNSTLYLGGSYSNFQGLGVMRFGLDGTTIAMKSDQTFGWTSGEANGANDSALSRISAGVLGVGTGAAASVAGQLNLTTLSVAGVTYANRPGTPTAGMVVYITDSNTATWGATIAGGGANKVLGWYNGTNWTVAGA